MKSAFSLLTRDLMIYKFMFSGEPKAKGRPRFTRRGFSYTPKETRDAEALLRKQTLIQLPKDFKLLDQALSISIIFYIKRPKSKKKAIHCITRPDIDNYVKTVLDAFNSIVFTDDSIIVELYAKKVYGDPGMIVHVSTIDSTSKEV